MVLIPTIESTKKYFQQIAFYFVLPSVIGLAILFGSLMNNGWSTESLLWLTITMFFICGSVKYILEYVNVEKSIETTVQNNYVRIQGDEIELRRWQYKRSIAIAEIKEIKYNYPYVRFILLGHRLDVKEGLSIFDETELNKFMSQIMVIVANGKNA